MKSMVVCSASFAALMSLVSPHARGQTDAVQQYMATRPDLILCAAYSVSQTDSLRQELIGRKLLTDTDLKMLAKKTVYNGMSECGLLASYRIPQSIEITPKYQVLETPVDIAYHYKESVDHPRPLDIYFKGGTIILVMEELTINLR